MLADRGGLGEAVARRLDALRQLVTVVHHESIPDDVSADVIVDCIADFRSLVALGRQLEARAVGAPVRLDIVSSNIHDVLGTEPIDPASALLIGPLRVIPQENPTVRTRFIDVARTPHDDVEVVAEAIVAELANEIEDQIVALRLNHRWTLRYDPAPVARGDGGAVAGDRAFVDGAFVVFGGLGQIGLTAARALVDAGFRTLIERVKRSCLEAWANQDVPFEEVVEAVQPRRTANQNPLFQVMFVIQNAPRARLEIPGLPSSRLISRRRALSSI